MSKPGRAGDTTEVLARAIHEEYVRKQTREGHTAADNPSVVRWEELPEHLKESNRRQAGDIGAKLHSIKCDVVPLTDPGEDRFAFTPDEIERLARMEHERWFREREADGWTFAPEKDVHRKRTPYLVPWEELSEEIRDYDRNAVRRIPAVLARAGLWVMRRREETDDGGT